MKKYSNILIAALFTITVVSISWFDAKYLKLYAFTINDNEYSANLDEFDSLKAREIEEYKNNLINSSREHVLNSYERDDITSTDDLESYEEIQVIENGNNINIEVIHKIPFSKKEVIEYDKETVKDNSKYTDYNKVTQNGVAGYEETSLTRVYVNGVEVDAIDIQFNTVDAVNEITTVGTKERPVYTPQYNSSQNTVGNSNANSNWSTGSNSSNSSSKKCQFGDLSCGYFDTSIGIESGLCIQTESGAWRCPMPWVEY